MPSPLARIIILCICMFGSNFVQGQTINTPTVTGTPVCGGSSVELTFTVTNGNNHNKHFSSNAIYEVYDDLGGAALLTRTFEPGVAPIGDNASLTFTITVNISNDPVAYPSNTNYRFFIFTSGQNVTSPYSDYFTVSNPTLNFTGNTTICKGETFNITGNLTGIGTKDVVVRNSLNDEVGSGTFNDVFSFSRTIDTTTTYYFEVTDQEGCTIYEELTIQVFDLTPPQATNSDPICIGGTLNLYASSISEATYSWTGPNGFTSTAQNPSISNATIAMAGTYSVVATVNGCSSEPATTIVEGSLATGSQTTAGTNSWIGHVYDGTGFNTYAGNYTETESFDRNFGGNTTCFGITANSNPISIYTETYSVRYQMNSTRKGLFVVDLGSDDGSRLRVDGTLVYSNWADQAYSVRPRILMNLNGNSNLVYEFYENAGGNRVSFNNIVLVLENKLGGNIEQEICPGQTAVQISGDVYGTLPIGISRSGTGYQWSYSTTPNGTKTDIAGATAATFTPDVTTAPFNGGGTFYIFRKATLGSSNNTGIISYTATNISNPAILKVIPTVSNNTIRYGDTGTVCATADENGNLNISALAGMIFTSVDFASYGTPNGSCGSFTLSTCHSASSQSVVENYLLGENSASIPATNAIFGDPCSGTYKRLYVQASYGPPGLCSGDQPITISGSIPEGSGSFTYSWEVSTTGPDTGFSTAPGSNTLQNYTPGPLQQTSWFKRNILNGKCEPFGSNVVEISVYEPVSNNEITLANGSSTLQTICTGSNPGTISGAVPTGGDGTYTYLWESSTTGAASGFAPATGTNNLANYEPGALSQTTWFRRTVNSSVCDPSQSNVAEIRINPLPGLTPTSGDTTICLGETTNLTGTFSGTGPWTVRGTTNGAAFSVSAPSSSLSYALSPTVNTTVKITEVEDANGCINNEVHTFNITVLQENIWTGAADTNWNNTANWSCSSLPTLGIDVLIPGGLTNYPELYSGSNALARKLTIEAGASVLISGNWLRMTGDLINTGNFDVGNGSVSFQGTTVQSIFSGAFANDNILNLSIKNPAGVVSQANIRILNSLKVEEGYLDTGNSLLLVSDSSGTAYIDGGGNGQVAGTVSMQRYLSNSFGYKYFSSPFQNSTVGDLAAFFSLTNPETGFPHLYEYIEGRKDSLNNELTGWKKYLDTAASLKPGSGYAINPSGVAETLTLELSGIVNNGPVNVALENNNGQWTNGFNLVGNPYPSPIDWELMVSNLGGIDNAIHFFTATAGDRYTGTYTSYVDGVSTDGRSSSIIPSMQGFFVRVSDPVDGVYPATASLEFRNNYRVGNQTGQAYYKTKNKAEIPQIKLKATFKGEEDADVTVIYFNEGGSPEFEKELDAQKLLNTAVNVPSFYSMSSKKEKLAINAISWNALEEMEIPLGITAERSGEMTLALAETLNLFPSLHIYLKDYQKNIIKDLDRDPIYSFTSQKGQIHDRFVLMFSSEKLSPAEFAVAMEDFTLYNENKEVVVKLNLPNNAQGTIILSNMSGQVLQSKKGSGKEEIRFSGILSTGVYLVTLKTEKGSQTKKVIFKE